VRLGRPANDNHRRPWHVLHTIFLAMATILAVLALLTWTLT
jgi:hypothetical protein